MIRLKTILHPTDFSEHSRYALEVACALAREQAAQVILLHVVPPPAPVSADAPAVKARHTEEDVKAYREEMAGLLARARERASWAKVEPVLREGPVAEVIARTVAERPCDLIVMGTHGRSGGRRPVMGSVAAEVTCTAPCPVVTVQLPRPQP